MRVTEFGMAIGNWFEPLPHSRMGVYRNNVAAALVNALRVRFPVTEQLVGGKFFSMMMLEYSMEHRPLSPVLIEYGDGVPEFVRGFGPAAHVPYLADLAALEDLWWRAYHSPEAKALDVTALSHVDAEKLATLRCTFHPSAGLLASNYAVGSIWHAHRAGRAMTGIATRASESVVVVRPEAVVEVRTIAPGSLAFLRMLQRGDRLGDAIEHVLVQYPDFDITAELGALFALGIATGFAA